ncbi:hypothetical protein RJ639_020375 [Escallonia herrerae]|uniref:Uncharacterized protein n=1 Tax=Escallonia herrerae TaxID=1293975 RepID=A0AA88V6V8_9ASTE|nr:hypothetical protein RJ639_020375 [Escallonia herrerae]
MLMLSEMLERMMAAPRNVSPVWGSKTLELVPVQVIALKWTPLAISLAVACVILWSSSIIKDDFRMYVVPTLSHRMRGMAFKGKRSSRSKLVSQLVSARAAATAQYSASVEDRDTERCFLEHHEMGFAAADFDNAIAKDLIDLELTDCAMVGCLEIVVSRDRMAAEMALYSEPRPCRILTMSCTFVMAAPAVASSSAMERMSRCEIVTANKLDGQLRGRIKLHDSGIANGIVGVDNRGVGGHYLRKAVEERIGAREPEARQQQQKVVHSSQRLVATAKTRGN